MANKPMERTKCKARKRNGEQCGNRPLRGLSVCRMHGGASPQGRAAAKRRLAEQAVMNELERSKLTGKAVQGTTDPLGELQKLTTEMIHFKDQLTLRVNDLGDNLANYDEKGSEQVKTEIDVYLKVIDKLTKLLDIALKHDIEGKRLSLETAKAELVAAALFRVLNGIGVSNEQMETAKTMLHKELTTIAQTNQ